MSKIALEASWLKHLETEFDQDYMIELKTFLKLEAQNKKSIFPAANDIFQAFNMTPLSDVKVVILGQDPYHGDGQAHGMSFSVKEEVKTPPSLRNIYKELEADLGCKIPKHGNLESWAKQGVLLLNTVLTVEKGRAGSHRKKGWEQFTDKVIEVLNAQKVNLVFILWGAPAQKKIKMIDEEKHLILTAPHPSPLSSYRGFFGCKHFSQTNKYLVRMGSAEIDWTIK